MSKALKIELGKAFRTKGFRFAIFFGIAIAILQSMWVYRNTYRANDAVYPEEAVMEISDEKNQWWFESGILEGWIGTEVFSMYNELFFLVLPILTVLPYSMSFYREWNSGYVNQMITRCGRWKYLTAKFIAVFVSGGIAASVPMLLSLVAAACLFPAVGSDPLSLQSPVGNADMWAGLFYEKPVWYAFCYIGIDLLYGGIFACIAMVSSMRVSNWFGAAVAPLLVNCTCYYGLDSLFPELRPFNPAVFMNPSQTYNTNRIVCVAGVTACLIAGLAVVYLWSNRKRDVL